RALRRLHASDSRRRERARRARAEPRRVRRGLQAHRVHHHWSSRRVSRRACVRHARNAMAGAWRVRARRHSRATAPQHRCDRASGAITMNKKRMLVILGLAAVVAVGLATWFVVRSRHSADSLTLYGNVDIREVELAFRVGGRLASVRYEEGDAVKQGDLVAE